jgi:succinylglutamate desuccinylase
MLRNTSLESLLIQFGEAVSKDSSYPWLYKYDGKKHSFRIHISCLIHGDETGSLPAAIRTIEGLESGSIKYGGQVCITLGNPEAARKNKRFLVSDLNRLFLKNDLENHEANRARVLMPIFNKADLLLDLHQTILHTKRPFYIFPRSKVSLNWARAMRLSDSYIDATPSKDSLTRCADEFFWHQNKPAITLELSKKGLFEKSIDLAQTAIRRVLAIADRIEGGEDVSQMAKRAPRLKEFQTIYRHPFNPNEGHLKPGLHNFLPVTKDEVLSLSKTEEIRSPCDGILLFPKYLSEAQINGELSTPKELFRIIKAFT